MNQSDLTILIAPYLAIGAVVMAMFLLILFMRMPRNGDKDKTFHFGATIRRLLSVSNYREGVIAQFFYVGAQIMCWTFIIQYGTRIFMAQGMEEQAAEVMSQKYNIAAMVIFCVSRFIATYLMKFFNPGKMLRTFAIIATILMFGVIGLQNIWGLYSLVAVSACMSLMFPTIYGIALKGMGEDAKFGAAGLIMAILGGSILPPLQARIIDMGTIGNLFPAVNASFILPLICFVVVAWYGIKAYQRSIV
jgi:FHS family L-fucose permease-like MFS transporter